MKKNLFVTTLFFLMFVSTNGICQQYLKGSMVGTPFTIVKIQSLANDEYLDADDAVKYPDKDGRDVQTWGESTTNNQIWLLQWVKDEFDRSVYRIICRGNNKSLDCDNPSTSNGTKVQTWTSFGTTHQEWYILKYRDYTSKSFECAIISSANRKYLDVDNGASRGKCQLWQQARTNNQKWIIKGIGGH